MKRVLVTLLALLLAAVLAGCGPASDDTAQLKKDAAFAKLCHDEGGVVVAYGVTYNQFKCQFDDDVVKEQQ